MKRIKKILLGGIMMIPAPVFSQNMMMTMGQNTTVPVEQTTHYKRYHGDGIDDVLRLVPTASVFGLKMLGVEAESSWKRRIAVSVLSFGVNAAVTYSLKKSIHKMRPDGTDNESFPSGHTSVAFCGATTLMHEYRKVSPWIGVAGYAVATGVAVDRVRRNRHHWEDVVAGAAIGVASAEAGYLIGDWILGKNKKKGKESDGEKEKDINDNISLSVAPTGIDLAIRLF